MNMAATSTVTPWPTLKDARSFLEQGSGKGVKIAVLDSGVETTHPLLHGLTLADDWAVVDRDIGKRTVIARLHGTALPKLRR